MNETFCGLLWTTGTDGNPLHAKWTPTTGPCVSDVIREAEYMCTAYTHDDYTWAANDDGVMSCKSS